VLASGLPLVSSRLPFAKFSPLAQASSYTIVSNEMSGQNKPVHKRPLISDHLKQSTFLSGLFIADPFIIGHVHNRPVFNRPRS